MELGKLGRLGRLRWLGSGGARQARVKTLVPYIEQLTASVLKLAATAAIQTAATSRQLETHEVHAVLLCPVVV